MDRTLDAPDYFEQFHDGNGVFLGLPLLLAVSLIACTFTTQLSMVNVAKRWSLKSSGGSIKKQACKLWIPFRLLIKTGCVHRPDAEAGASAPFSKKRNQETSLIFSALHLPKIIVFAFSPCTLCMCSICFRSSIKGLSL